MNDSFADNWFQSETIQYQKLITDATEKTNYPYTNLRYQRSPSPNMNNIHNARSIMNCEFESESDDSGNTLNLEADTDRFIAEIAEEASERTNTK